MLKKSSLKQLQGKKNLLAFSAGVDSSALFFILLQNSIAFDIAIVDYGIREQSKEEVSYARELAKKYKQNCHFHKAEPISNNFEYNARAERYGFFDTLVQKHNYDNLITAHHLGDRLEWMLMQFCKGAGCAEIAGMREIQKRSSYTLVRPLLHLDKEDLLQYLKENSLKYFEDSSNLDEEFKRNEFRHNYANPMLKKYRSGIEKSFAYLDEDTEFLLQENKIQTINSLAYFHTSSSKRSDIFTTDKYLKSQGYMLSANEREILKNKQTFIVGRKFIINMSKDFIFIVPYKEEKIALDERFKDRCRVLKIEPKLRVYLAQDSEAFIRVKELLSNV